MALQKEFSSSVGFDCPEFYISISHIVFRRGADSEIYLVGHKNRQAKLDKKAPLQMFFSSASLELSSTDNLFKQAYEAIKTQDEFLNCIDV
jgi:hypothetical protein